MIERYTRPEMGKIWTPENRYQAWLRVELAVCEAWNRVGEISDADMETLRKEADFTVDRAFVDRANEIEETTRHDVIAFLTAIEEKVGPVSRFIHLGCTSSDIVDTAGTITKAADLIMANGANSVRAIASHCIMSGPADERVEASALSEMVFTDSIPYRGSCKKVKELTVSDMLAETIRRVMENESISSQYLI